MNNHNFQLSCGKRLVDDNANKQIELTIQLSNFVPVGAGVGEGSGMEVGMQLSSVKDERRMSQFGLRDSLMPWMVMEELGFITHSSVLFRTAVLVFASLPTRLARNVTALESLEHVSIASCICSTVSWH